MAVETVQAVTPLNKKILYTEEQVDAVIDRMAGSVIETYQGVNPLFVCLLRGGAPFSAKLMSAISRQDPRFQPELDYMTVRTYGNEREPRPPQIVMDVSPSTKVAGRHVILLDDVLDTGVTAEFATEHFLDRGADDVSLAVLVKKLRHRTAYGEPSLFGVETPDIWLTGMGLDDAQLGKEANRWAGYIAVANGSPE